MKVVCSFLLFGLFLFIFLPSVHALIVTPSVTETGDNYNIKATVRYDVSLEPVENATVLYNVSKGWGAVCNESCVFSPNQNLTEIGNGTYCSGGSCDVDASDPQAPAGEGNYTICVRANKTGFKDAYDSTNLTVRCGYNLELNPDKEFRSVTETMFDTFDIIASDSSSCPGNDIEYIIEKSVNEYDTSCTAELLGNSTPCPITDGKCNITVPRGGKKDFKLNVTLVGDGLCDVNLTVTDPRGESAASGMYSLGYCITPRIFNFKYSGNWDYLDLSAIACYNQTDRFGANFSVRRNILEHVSENSTFFYDDTPGYITGRITDPHYNETLKPDGSNICGDDRCTGDTIISYIAYDTQNLTKNETMEKPFRILDFDLSSIGVAATVGVPFVLPAKITNRGFFTDSYTVSTFLKGGGTSVLAEGGLKQTGKMETNGTATVPFRAIVLITGQHDRLCINATSNTQIASTAERYLQIFVNAKEASLPEFGWSGLLQIMLLAAAIILLF